MAHGHHMPSWRENRPMGVWHDAHTLFSWPGLFLPIPSSSPSRSWSISIGTYKIRSTSTVASTHQPRYSPKPLPWGGREIKLTRVKHQKVAWTWSPSTVEALDTFMPPRAPSAFATLQGGALRMLCFLLPGHKIFVMSCHVMSCPIPAIQKFRWCVASSCILSSSVSWVLACDILPAMQIPKANDALNWQHEADFSA